jgi:cytochrome c oxidase subunit IV
MCAILGPPVVLLLLIGVMAIEGDYTVLTRLDFFGEDTTEFVEHH